MIKEGVLFRLEKVVNCLLSDEKMLEWATLNAYIPARESVVELAVSNNPDMRAFVDAAAAELSRTGPPANLGPNYSQVSQPLWTAIQAALTGVKTPQEFDLGWGGGRPIKTNRMTVIRQ